MVCEISKIVFELTRQLEDRVRMMWEDDNGKFIREQSKMKTKNTKLKSRLQLLERKYQELSALSPQNSRCKRLHEKSVVENIPLVSILKSNESLTPPPRTSAEESKNEDIVPGESRLNSQLLLGKVAENISNSSEQRTIRRRVTVGNTHIDKQVNSSVSRRIVRGLSENPSGESKCIDVVRKKSLRDVLPGHTCLECRRYYDAMVFQGVVSTTCLDEMLQKCSRHKSKWAVPNTPDGFWDLSVHTPDGWNE
jgi:hypothetical protein